jgi:hypothetical protein
MEISPHAALVYSRVFARAGYVMTRKRPDAGKDLKILKLLSTQQYLNLNLNFFVPWCLSGKIVPACFNEEEHVFDQRTDSYDHGTW